MSFQLVSDLHLEFSASNPVVEKHADNLILAGDIGYPTQKKFIDFLTDMCKMFDKVFYIAGNHEYYCGLTKPEVDELLTALSNDLGFVFLNNSTYKFSDTLTIIGTTLWTKTTARNSTILESCINDYRKILNADSKLISSSDTGQWHDEAVQFLFREFSKPGDKLVITHHLPSMELIHDKYKGNPINCAFASSLDIMFKGSGVKVWCAGHTHSRIEKKISDIQFYVNPHGYPGENPAPDTSFTFTILQN